MNLTKSSSIVLSCLLLVSVASSSALAGPQKKKNWNQQHPRRAEVNKRLQNQQRRVDKGLSQGKLTQGQAEKIQNQDAAIRSQEQRDAAQHDGHITKAEQRQLNREENAVSREINRDERGNVQRKDWNEDHPRRAEVNKRLENQQDRVNQGLSQGKLTPGQAEKIQNQDAGIRAQERRDAAMNGGHITKAEQRQLNREENAVSREINRDEQGNAKTPPVAAPPAGTAPAEPSGQ